MITFLRCVCMCKGTVIENRNYINGSTCAFGHRLLSMTPPCACSPGIISTLINHRFKIENETFTEYSAHLVFKSHYWQDCSRYSLRLAASYCTFKIHKHRKTVSDFVSILCKNWVRDNRDRLVSGDGRMSNNGAVSEKQLSRPQDEFFECVQCKINQVAKYCFEPIRSSVQPPLFDTCMQSFLCTLIFHFQGRAWRHPTWM